MILETGGFAVKYREEPFSEWDERKRAWDAQLPSQLRELVQPGDVEFFELALQSSFVGTQWELHLNRLGIRAIVFCGLHLDWCIEGHVRQARDLGYMPIVVGDACACGRREDEPEAIRRINDYFAPVLPAEEVVALMAEARAGKVGARCP